MLRLFRGGPDHPMADPKEAKRILEALPAQEQKALEELANWHESLGATDGFRLEQRLQLICAVDDAAQPRLRKLAREYLASARPARFQETQIWTRIHDYWQHAARAYLGCLEAARKGDSARSLPAIVVRGLRSLAQVIKWQQARYGPMDPGTWGTLGGVYAAAESKGVADVKVALGAPGMESTPRQEFLRAILFSASSPDSLLPVQVELAERLIAELAGDFALAAAPSAQTPYWIQLGYAMPPQRAAKSAAPSSPAVRYFGPAGGVAALQGLIQRTRAGGAVPAGLNLGGSYSTELALDTMQHLATYWSPEPPERQHPRHSVKSQVMVTHGFDSLLEALGGGGSLDFGAAGGESWVVDNVSAGGFGALVPQAKNDWLQVGSLLAIRPEGGDSWLVGMVRRVNRLPAQKARVGVQTLSRAPALSRFAMGGAGEEQGILLRSPGLRAGEARIALRSGVFVPGLNLEAEFEGRQHVYMPQSVVERGEDYEIARFREMVREA